MDQIATLKPWAVVTLALFLIGWGLTRLGYLRMATPRPIYSSVSEVLLALLAIITGILLLLPS